MKWLVVGDLHGQHEIAQAALDTEYPVVFIGDYLDSFRRSIDDQVITLRLVLDAARSGNAVTLRGNHDLSYWPPNVRCGGYKAVTQFHFNHLRADFEMFTQNYVWKEGFLISHAGVSQKILDEYEMTLEEYLDNGQFSDVGYQRMGPAPSGGLFWCDWRTEFVPVAGIKQIVGHTRGQLIREKEGNYCIDVLEDRDSPQGLLIENGVAEIYNF